MQTTTWNKAVMEGECKERSKVAHRNPSANLEIVLLLDS